MKIATTIDGVSLPGQHGVSSPEHNCGLLPEYNGGLRPNTTQHQIPVHPELAEKSSDHLQDDNICATSRAPGSMQCPHLQRRHHHLRVARGLEGCAHGGLLGSVSLPNHRKARHFTHKHVSNSKATLDLHQMLRQVRVPTLVVPQARLFNLQEVER